LRADVAVQRARYGEAPARAAKAGCWTSGRGDWAARPGRHSAAPARGGHGGVGGPAGGRGSMAPRWPPPRMLWEASGRIGPHRLQPFVPGCCDASRAGSSGHRHFVRCDGRRWPRSPPAY